MRPEPSAALQQLKAAYDNPHLLAEDPRPLDRPVFGCLTPHIPLELLHAAEVIPVKIQSAKAARLAPAHLQSYSCGFARAAADGILGERYDYLDGLLAAKTCDVAVSLFQICQEVRPRSFAALISLPGNCDEEAVAYLAEEFAELKAALEAYRGLKISSERLHHSIGLYNDIRRAVMTLWQRRDAGTLSLAAGDIVRALKGTQVLPPETALSLLNAFLAGPASNGPAAAGPRLLLMGNSYNDAALVDFIEKYGARVVYEDTTALGRYFGHPVEADGEPLANLARHYAAKVSGCYRLDFDQRIGHIERNLGLWSIDACINVVQNFCDTSLFEAPLLDEIFRSWKIPYLFLEVNDTSPGLSQVETRIQAFLEMIGGIL